MTRKVPPDEAAGDPLCPGVPREPRHAGAEPSVDELTQQVMTWIAMSMRLGKGRPMTESLEMLNDLGLTLPQVVALHVIAFEGSSTMTRLVERIGLSTSAVSHLLHRLVHMGLCERQDDPTDRRQRRIRLTDEGQDVVKKLMKSRMADTRGSIEPLSPTTRVKLGEVLTLIHADMADRISALEQEERQKETEASTSPPSAPDLSVLIDRLEQLGDDVAEVAEAYGDRVAAQSSAMAERAVADVSARLERALQRLHDRVEVVVGAASPIIDSSQSQKSQKRKKEKS